MLYGLTKVWHPENYQGGSASLGYFEGWYFKCVTADGRAIAVIPGIAIERDGRRYAFVQINTSAGRSLWFELPYEAFSFSETEFDLRFGACSFSRDGITLDLTGEAGRVSGHVGFGEFSPWPVRLLSPGIMGPFRFAPFMECYHGVISMDHSVSGEVRIDNDVSVFDGGRGYIEKDWGRSFPKSWIWMQCNGFDRPGVSLTASAARIPWLGSSFVGSIAGLLLDGALYRFTTYTGARLTTVRHTTGEGELVLEDRRHRLAVTASGALPGALRSPVLGAMTGTVYESLRGEVHVRLSEQDGGRVLFDGAGTSAGIELMDPEADLADGT